MDEPRIILTADEAISLLPEGEYVHNTTGGRIMIGIDMRREDAVNAMRSAVQLEIGGPACKAYRHPLVAWDSNTHCTFYEADMAKVEALEAAKATPSREQAQKEAE